MFFCLVTSWEDVEAEGLGFDSLWRVGRFFYVPARRKTEKQQFLKRYITYQHPKLETYALNSKPNFSLERSV